MVPATRRTLLYSLVLGVLALAAFWYFDGRSSASPQKYRTQAVDRGDIVQSISANGTLNPVILVNVGTQVSGTVHKLYADFNDRVKVGQILAELDPALFQAQLKQSEANVLNAQANLKLARAKEERTRELVAKNFVTRSQLDDATETREAAEAQLALVQAQLKRDRTNLEYSVIRSPISGVVVARNVNVGQTVAASFQTPTLYQIAQDLRQMQIDTSVAEADIGPLRTGQPVRFTVDTFQDREFTGTIRQIRLNPTIQQNVVTYDVVVLVTNENGELLPGMTAHVQFSISRKAGVLRVPNAALRFRPSDNDTPVKPRPGGKATVYRLGQGQSVPVPVPVKTGIADNNFTEIAEGDIKVSDKLVVREIGDRAQAGGTFRFRLF